MEQIYVPLTVRKAVLALMHNQNGHYDSVRTHDAVCGPFFLSRVFPGNQKYVRNCRRCQTTAMRSAKITLCPLEPREPNEFVEWDITGPITDPDGSK